MNHQWLKRLRERDPERYRALIREKKAKEYARRRARRLLDPAARMRADNLKTQIDFKQFHPKEWNQIRHRKKHLSREYRLTLAQLQTMFSAQGGKCPICSRTLTLAGSRETIANVDHDHSTGTIRALLCGPCNRELAGVESAVRRSLLSHMLVYLAQHK